MKTYLGCADSAGVLTTLLAGARVGRLCPAASSQWAMASVPNWLRSMTPKRARRPSDASVDPTDARRVAGFGPDYRAVCRGGNRARRSSEVHTWDRTDRRPPLWFG